MIMDWLGQVLKRFNELVPPPGEAGAEVAFVLNDAVVIVGIDEEHGKRGLTIKAVLGEPERLDITTGMLEEASSGA